MVTRWAMGLIRSGGPKWNEEPERTDSKYLKDKRVIKSGVLVTFMTFRILDRVGTAPPFFFRNN
jgi:hypothetical protein